ncbi:[FeFe] hydrogenase H-cluster maturation GTPase HydF [Clostridia bacterium]|nr:[FeFe] hydrogenase H-cluster maturation GTPase HydF [Clostridia bacterium]
MKNTIKANHGKEADTLSSLNGTPSSERLHIGFFGRRNVGKSSLVNAVTGQELSVVSDVLGTTTDPVRKAMELLPIGPVVIIDTPGFDDDAGELGALRIEKMLGILEVVDVAVLVQVAGEESGYYEKTLEDCFLKRKVPYIIARNKSDLVGIAEDEQGKNDIYVSAKSGAGIDSLKEMIGKAGQTGEPEQPLISDLIRPGEYVLLITPIDSAAPKGRMILPQQQIIREVLNVGAINIVTKETELAQSLAGLSRPPVLAVTDSQAFKVVSEIIPEEIPLTSFSILFARYKGLLTEAVKGVKILDTLVSGDKVLICEGCTHHRQCDDIGTVKLPRMIREYTGAEPDFRFTSGGTFPSEFELSGYKLIIHCGGCMLRERTMRYRTALAVSAGVPITNYGIVIAQITGILARSIAALR